MRIRIVQSGGFAGLKRERVVETAQLPAPERAALEGLVHASGFFALPARAPAGGHAVPDARQLDLEIDDGAGRSHRVRLSEHAASPAVRDLVERALNASAPEQA